MIFEIEGCGAEVFVAGIRESVRFFNWSFDAAGVGSRTSIYVEFSDLEDLLAF